MSLDGLFNVFTENPGNEINALLTITSGAQEGMYLIPLHYKVLTHPVPKGSVAADLTFREEASGSVVENTGHDNESINLRITRSTFPKVLSPSAASYDVAVTHGSRSLFHPTHPDTNIASFKVNLAANQDSPCQARAAYFQSLESPIHKVQCCIPL